jgi:xanthine dehydrogenase accessory factor
MNPFSRLEEVLQQEACVLVTLNLILGSSPRESGCRMIVTADHQYGSIGGGNLEYTACKEARDLLRESVHSRQLHRPYGLGPVLNQCCGGAVTLLYEVFSGACPAWVEDLGRAAEESQAPVLALAIDTKDPVRCVIRQAQKRLADVPPAVAQAAEELFQGQTEVSDVARENSGLREVTTDAGVWWLQRIASPRHAVFLFGAGHVGQCVARQLEALPFDLTWIDSRAGLWSGNLAANVHTLRCDQPELRVAQAPPGCIFVVMTHSHQLDEDICFEVLERADFAWLGLIGSLTKRRRFVQRLNKRGLSEETLQRLVCPVGLDGIRGKQPATIALSLAAQLMMEQPWTRANN